MGRKKRKAKSALKAPARSRWRRLLIPGAIGLAVAVGLATWHFLPRKSPLSDAAQYRGGARLAVDKDLIDFGTVRFERFVQARFLLRNVGDRSLRIQPNPPVDVVEGC